MNFHIGRVCELKEGNAIFTLEELHNSLKTQRISYLCFPSEKQKVLLPYRRHTLVTNASFLFLKSSYPFFFFPPKDSEEVPEQAESHLDIFSKHSFYAFLLHDNIAWILNLILFHHIFYGLAQINLFIRLKKKQKEKLSHPTASVRSCNSKPTLLSSLLVFFFLVFFFFFCKCIL